MHSLFRRHFSLTLALSLTLLSLPSLAKTPPKKKSILAEKTSAGPELSISMVAATSVVEQLPFEAVRSTGWKADPQAKYVKLHLYADETFSLSKVELESCGSPFSHYVQLFLNFDEGVENFYSPDLTSHLVQSFENNPTAQETRSLTINFSENTGVCIRNLKLYGKNNQVYQIKTPRLLNGQVTASSTAQPTQAHEVMNIFDSRYEHAWLSEGQGQGQNLDFQFEEEVQIEKIKLWNGYQRSDMHCYSNGRLKKIKVEGDNGYTVEIEAEDVMGSQELALPQPFRGKHLRLSIDDTYAGKAYKDLAISELRFYDGKSWMMLNPLSAIQNINQTHATEFKKSEMAELLDQSLLGMHQDKKKYGDWTIRLRSDGSTYIQGRTEYNTKKDQYFSQSFDALGNYQILSAKPGQLKIKVFGFLRQHEYEGLGGGDCNGCGRDCNQTTDEDGAKLSFFNDELLITRKNKGGYWPGQEGGDYIVKNLSKKKSLNFNTLEMQKD